MPKRYRFKKEQVQRIRKAAQVADIHEICYLVFGRGCQVECLLRVPNRAEDTVMQHVFRGEDFVRARMKPKVNGLHFLGYLHTHIVSPAFPSPGDLKGYKVGSLIFIYSELFNELRAFRIGPKVIEKIIEIC